MARMYPRTLREDWVKSKAEVKVHALLRDGLDDEWEVFHSAGWIERDPAEGAEDGEIDFVLCHPDEGIVCLEVKGGGIECQYGEWFRLVDGQRESMRDPFAQALDHRYDLERKIAKLDGWKDHNLFIAHALAFPDITVHELALAPDAPREIILDRNDVTDVASQLDRAIGYHRGARDKRGSPGEKGAEMLRRLLAPELMIRVPLASQIMEEETELRAMTHEQARILARFGRDKRLVVYGCAGSGKTMIAVEQARRVAESGQKVLFICFNRPLREFLRERYPCEGVEYWNFHALCLRLASLADIDLPKYPKGEAPPSYWDEELPTALVAAIDQLGPQYDAIFVDEAQDLENDWLDALTLTLRDPEEGHVWLFLDANQAIYEAKLEVPDEYRPFDLTVNCRNTQAIHREIVKLYEGPVQPEVSGPEGRDPVLIKAPDQGKAVAAILGELVTKEEIVPQDIAVLSAHNINKSEVAKAKLPGDLQFSADPPAVGPYVRFSSIPAFKGLEAPVVILCELEDLAEEKRNNLLYVGMSRAKNHCVLVVPDTSGAD